MMLTSNQIELVQTSFEHFVPIGDTVADLFYDRLFDLDPTLRPLFSADLSDQKKKLMHMLMVAVRGLNKIDDIIPAVEALGARHVQYGVQDEHYAIVGEALLWTLEHGLGDAFTPNVEAAWTAVYTTLADTAIAGANRVIA